MQVSSAVVKSQQDFLDLLRSTSPVSNAGCSNLSHGAALLAVPGAAHHSTVPSSSVMVYPSGSAGAGTQQQLLQSISTLVQAATNGVLVSPSCWLKQFAQFQQLVPQQPQSFVSEQANPEALAQNSTAQVSSSNKQPVPESATKPGVSPAKLQQFARKLQQQQQAMRPGSCNASRVSSDLTQMLTLSVSASSTQSEGGGRDDGSVAGDI